VDLIPTDVARVEEKGTVRVGDSLNVKLPRLRLGSGVIIILVAVAGGMIGHVGSRTANYRQVGRPADAAAHHEQTVINLKAAKGGRVKHASLPHLLCCDASS
jgi:hypothetical protein